MNGAPGPNGPYAFTTDVNGNASMQLVISNAPGPVLIDVLYLKCVKPGLVDCDEKDFRDVVPVRSRGAVERKNSRAMSMAGFGVTSAENSPQWIF